MRNGGQGQPKEQSNLFLFLALVLIALFLVYQVVTIPFGIGRTKGLITAAYNVPAQDAGAGDEVFNHKELVKPTEELIGLGQKIYTNNCASCHGAEGLGDGAAGQRLAVKPRNFHDGEGWKNGASVIEMYDTLMNGVPPAMPSFSVSLNPRQKYAVGHYIHAEFMGDVDYPEPTAEQLAALPEPSGAVEINIQPYAESRVPIRYAMEKLARENENSHSED